MCRSFTLWPLFFGFFFILCSQLVSGMMERTFGLGVGSIIKRVENLPSSIPYRPVTTFYDSTGTLDIDSYLRHRKTYMRQEFFAPARKAYDDSHCIFNMHLTDGAPRKRQRILDKEIYDPELLLLPPKWNDDFKTKDCCISS